MALTSSEHEPRQPRLERTFRAASAALVAEVGLGLVAVGSWVATPPTWWGGPSVVDSRSGVTLTVVFGVAGLVFLVIAAGTGIFALRRKLPSARFRLVILAACLIPVVFGTVGFIMRAFVFD